MNIQIISIVILLIFGFIGCSSSELMISDSISDITIDGNQEDWSGKLKYFRDERIAIGFQNDDENLYICLVTSDRANAMKIMTLGLTVWFNPENGEQEIGVQYPKKMDDASSRRSMELNKNNQPHIDFKATVNTMMQYQGEYLLIDDNEEIFYAAPLGTNDGFEIKVGAMNEQFVYEAKVPIGNNSQAQIPINVFPNEKVAVRFETGEIDKNEMREGGGMKPGKGNGSEDMSGGMQGGGPPGGMRGDHGGSRPGMERLNFDVEVKLSK